MLLADKYAYRHDRRAAKDSVRTTGMWSTICVA